MSKPTRDKIFYNPSFMVILMPQSREKNLGSFSERLCENNQMCFAKPALSKVEGLNLTEPLRDASLRDCADRVSVHLCVISQVNSWLLFGFLGNFENNLASRVTGRDLFLGLNCFRKWERLRHDHFDFLLVD
jgi:hypothetical protein